MLIVIDSVDSPAGAGANSAGPSGVNVRMCAILFLVITLSFCP